MGSSRPVIVLTGLFRPLAGSGRLPMNCPESLHFHFRFLKSAFRFRHKGMKALRTPTPQLRETSCR